MKNVLILASGEMAQHFVQWIGKSRIDTNEYYVTCSDAKSYFLEKCSGNINIVDADPTSYMRVKNIMEEKDFASIFILMDDKKEALYAYKNVRMLREKTYMVFVSKWEDIELDDENVSIINVNEVLVNNLYEKLPNVPLIAKNIGLGKGEIMEVLIPLGSSFAYRHVGAISHRKWKIVAIYRNEKQLFVNNNTQIYPNDRLIIIGNSMVLEEVYKRVNKLQGVFPEPFGKNLYLIVDMEQEKEDILLQINEAIFLSNQLTKTKLFIRLINIDSLELIHELRALETDNIQLSVSYKRNEIFQDIDFDISQHDLGLFLLERKIFLKKKYQEHFISYKRPIYLFGEKSLYNIRKAVILMGNEMEMESLSTSIFDFSESLNLGLSLCDYNPEGDFEESQKIIEHYESLSRINSFKIKIEQKRVNPVRELLKKEAVLHIAPLHKKMKKISLFSIFSTNVGNYAMSIKKHPQLLIPVEGVIS